jgi:hypothetical protein
VKPQWCSHRTLKPTPNASSPKTALTPLPKSFGPLYCQLQASPPVSNPNFPKEEIRLSESPSTFLCYGGKLTREQLALVATPPGTATHRPADRGYSAASPAWRTLARARNENGALKNPFCYCSVYKLLSLYIEACRRFFPTRIT